MIGIHFSGPPQLDKGYCVLVDCLASKWETAFTSISAAWPRGLKRRSYGFNIL